MTTQDKEAVRGDELLPCRVCGYKAVIMRSKRHGLSRIACDNDETECPFIDCSPENEAFGIEMWNTRVTPPNAPKTSEVAAVGDGYYVGTDAEGMVVVQFDDGMVGPFDSEIQAKQYLSGYRVGFKRALTHTPVSRERE